MACGANLLGLFAALVVEIGKFVSAFEVHLVQGVRIDGVICDRRRWRRDCAKYGLSVLGLD